MDTDVALVCEEIDQLADIPCCGLSMSSRAKGKPPFASNTDRSSEVRRRPTWSAKPARCIAMAAATEAPVFMARSGIGRNAIAAFAAA